MEFRKIALRSGQRTNGMTSPVTRSKVISAKETYLTFQTEMSTIGNVTLKLTTKSTYWVLNQKLGK